MYRTLDGFVAAYSPDPEILAQLAPPTAPLLSALGASVVRASQTRPYEMYAYDLVALPDIPDPRTHGKTALDGYVDQEASARNSKHIDYINAHYHEGLTPELYAKHDLPEGLPFSGILDHAHIKGDDGEYVMPVDAYIGLLADFQDIHGKKAEAFAHRLPGYIEDFAARLQYSTLHTLLPEFRERMTRTEIVLDDGLDTLARGGGGRHLRTRTQHNIVIAPIEEQEHAVLTHEFIHLREDQGLYETFPDHPEVVHGLYEALASHLAAHLLYDRDIQLIDPTAFADEGDYETYRHMLDFLCNGGQQQVSIYDFIDTGMKPGGGINPDLGGAVVKSFPDHPGLFDELEALLQNLNLAENTTDPVQEKALREYMNDVRQHYQRLRRQGSAWRSLLGKINWLGRG